MKQTPAVEADDASKKPAPSSMQAARNGNSNMGQSLQHAANAALVPPKRASSSSFSNQHPSAQVAFKTTGLGGNIAEAATTATTATTLNDAAPSNSKMSATSSTAPGIKAGFFPSSPRSRSRQGDSDAKAKAAAEIATIAWSGGAGRVPPRRGLAAAGQDTALQTSHHANNGNRSNQQLTTSSTAEDADAPRHGAFSIAGMDGSANGDHDDDDDDDSLIDLEQYVDPSDDSFPGQTASDLPSPEIVQFEAAMPPPPPPTAEPVTAELAPDPEELEARIKSTVEQQLREFRQEDMRTRESDVPQNVPMLVTQTTRIEEEGPKSQMRTESPPLRYCKAACIILSLVILVGIGVGIVLAMGNQNGDSDKEGNESSTSISQAPVETPNEVPTNVGTIFPPTTAAPSQNPTMGPQSAEFFALLDILEPILAEGPTFNNRTSLQDPSAVEYRVLDWMANDASGLSDELELNVNHTYSLLERYAIAVAYHRLNGDSWRRQFQFLTGLSVCEWSEVTINPGTKGISCMNGIVISIGLQQNLLSGPFPPELFHLTMLENLYLDSNSITGTIPSEISHLSRLQVFSVYESELSGAIPSEIGLLTGIEKFILYSSSLSGTIPTEIGKMTSLQRVYIEDNEMDGNIPSEIGTMSSLSEFHAYMNNFSGTVPTEIQQLTQLVTLYLGLTQITGDLDPLFCDGNTLSFGPGGQLSSNCLVTYDGTPPRTNCTCCTICCNAEDRCEDQ